MNDLKQLQRLADLMINGAASDQEAAALSSILRNAPELQEAYLGYLDTHATLCWKFRERASETVAAPRSPVVVTKSERWTVATLLPWSVAVVAAIVATVALLRPADSSNAGRLKEVAAEDTAHENLAPHDATGAALPSTPPAETDAPALTALLVDQAGAKFAAEHGPDGVQFGVGRYELREGIVHLRFANGADLVVQAPAEFRIDDASHTRLDSGRVRAIVPPTAYGFTITTREVEFEDIGTEFSVSVDARGESAMHVFDGQVNVRRSGATELLQSVVEGERVRFHKGRLDEDPTLDLSSFPTPEHIGFLRWQSQRRQLADSPGLIAWFPFTRNANASVLTNVQRTHDAPDGRIASARWVSGRWPGKQALLFDRDADYVQLEIPGEFEELSIAVWLKADRFDREMHAILNSNLSDPGDVHFQLTRHGLPRGGILGPELKLYRWVGNPVPLAKWTHVVSVLSLPKRKSFIYVNGEIVMEAKLQNPGNVKIRPGVCRLGNWLPAMGYRGLPLRAFRGRIDEVAVWNRALDKTEILDLVERGRPSLIWSRENPPLGIPMPTP